MEEGETDRGGGRKSDTEEGDRVRKDGGQGDIPERQCTGKLDHLLSNHNTLCRPICSICTTLNSNTEHS